ncbi:hypothetical protein B0H13DRAFT_1869600 [Mycena leptocephala]|nr:hypothetical protein B0H13DRAFT_1869600 [Mycena leptocephala]
MANIYGAKSIYMFAPKQLWFMDLSLLFSHLSRLGKSLDPQEPKDRKPQPRDKAAADGLYGSTRYPSYLHALKGTYTRLAESVDDWWVQPADSELPESCEMRSVEGILNVAAATTPAQSHCLTGEPEICLRPTYSSFCKDVSLVERLKYG